MADQTKDQKDQPRHGHDVTGKDDPARLRPYEFNQPRPKEEIVKQAYEHEDPTPTQAENDQAKLDSMHQDPGSLDPQSAAAKKKQLESGQGGSYQTRQATPQTPKP